MSEDILNNIKNDRTLALEFLHKADAGVRTALTSDISIAEANAGLEEIPRTEGRR